MAGASQVFLNNLGGARLDLTLPASGRQAVCLMGKDLRSQRPHLAKLLVESQSGISWYHLKIGPRFPLGMNTEELEPAPVTIFPRFLSFPWTGSTFVCIPVEYENSLVQPRPVLKAPLPGTQRDRPFLPGTVKANMGDGTRCQRGELRLEFQGLQSGRYASIVQVNGENLPVRLVVRHHWLMIPVFVFVGALLSVLTRDYLAWARRRAANESRIAAIERGLNERRGAVVWDDLRRRNALRRARGVNRLLRFDEIEVELKEAKKELPKRAEIFEIQRRIAIAPLPRELKVSLERRLRSVTRLSSAPDEREIEAGLEKLKAGADTDFRKSFAEWLRQLRAHHAQAAGQIRQVPHGLDSSQALRLDRALDGLSLLIQDAEDLFFSKNNGIDLDPAQVDLLERIPGALRQLSKWVEGSSGLRESEFDRIIHWDLKTFPLVSLLDDGFVRMPSSPQLRQVSAGAAEALQPLTLELDLGASPELFELNWSIGDDRILGGPRLTYVFPERPWAEVQVVVSREGQKSRMVSWKSSLRRVWTLQRRAQRRVWLAEKGATLIGVALASAIAVALYWTEKPFGRMSDYVTMLAIGLGLDAGVIAGGGQILSQILNRLGLRSESEEKKKETV